MRRIMAGLSGLMLMLMLGITSVSPAGALSDGDPGWDCQTMGNHICGPLQAWRVYGRLYVYESNWERVSFAGSVERDGDLWLFDRFGHVVAIVFSENVH